MTSCKNVDRSYKYVRTIKYLKNGLKSEELYNETRGSDKKIISSYEYEFYN